VCTPPKAPRSAAQLWLKRVELEKLKRSSLRQYTNHVDLHITPLIGAVKLARLSAPVVQAFRDKLIETRSRALARKVLASLKSIIGEAMRRGLVAQNAALPVIVDVKKREQGKLTVGVDVPSKEEVSLLLERAQGRWWPFFVTAVFTGMRASELRGLTWHAVDFEQRVIHVRQRADLWGTIGDPKSAAGDRVIPMAPPVVNTLREWRLACPKGKLGLVFPNGRGNVESHANIAARGFEPLQRTCFGEAKYGLHSLRHFFASWAIEQGFSPKRLQALLGHSSIQMTFDTYGHLFPSLEDDHAKFAAGALQIRAAGGGT
jgi:integrase